MPKTRTRKNAHLSSEAVRLSYRPRHEPERILEMRPAQDAELLTSVEQWFAFSRLQELGLIHNAASYPPLPKRNRTL